MKQVGNVELPQEAFMSVLSMDVEEQYMARNLGHDDDERIRRVKIVGELVLETGRPYWTIYRDITVRFPAVDPEAYSEVIEPLLLENREKNIRKKSAKQLYSYPVLQKYLFLL